ncbi:hypothetical protein EC990672_5261A, partial [Escherichia coli 99.0672]
MRQFLTFQTTNSGFTGPL